MVGHQDIGVYRTACAAGIVLQPIQIKAVVFIGEKAGLAVITALNEWNGIPGTIRRGRLGIENYLPHLSEND